MSRLRRLKERKIKNRIKAAPCGLALALVIGSAQSLGTYALFSDTEDIINKIDISTGDIDVRVNEGFNHEWSDEDDDYYNDNDDDDSIRVKVHDLEIYNDGTLNQNISLSLISDISQYIDRYELVFKEYNNKIIETIDLSTSTKELRHNDKELVTLNSGDYINAEVFLTFNEEKIDDLVDDGNSIKIDMGVNILATQINKKNLIEKQGFSDLERQINSITITDYEDENIISTGAIKVNPANYIKDNWMTIAFKGHGKFTGLGDIIEGFDNIKKHTLIEQNGAFKNSQLINTGKEYKLDPVNGLALNDSFTENYIILEYEYDKNTDGNNDYYKRYKISFKLSNQLDGKGNRLAIGKVELMDQGTILNTLDETSIEEQIKIDEELIEPEIVEPLKEEVEVPSEPEVVEPPKEEVEAPSEPEVVEPPKVEETVVPSQPDIIAPPKEEIEIQE